MRGYIGALPFLARTNGDMKVNGIKPPSMLDRRFSVAPMMDGTDRHCRMFHRTLSKRALLWTEMVTADAVIHGDRERLIGFVRARVGQR